MVPFYARQVMEQIEHLTVAVYISKGKFILVSLIPLTGEREGEGLLH